MYYRSLIVISRLSLNTSNITSRSLITSYSSPLLLSSQQQHRYLTQNTPNPRSPGRLHRLLWGSGSTDFKTSTIPPSTPSTPSTLPKTQKTTMQRLKHFLSLAPRFERFFIRSRIIEDEDLARLISKTTAITVYAFLVLTTLGTFDIDTKPLLAGIGITGFTIGFALKEVATNFISGVFLVINKPFVRGCRIKIHGGGGGIEGLVHFIDIRYVHLKVKDRGIIMVPSAVVYTNPFTVFPVDDEANAGFLDMTKPPSSDATKSSESSSSSSEPKITNPKQTKLKMNLSAEPVGSFKKPSFKEKL